MESFKALFFCSSLFIRYMMLGLFHARRILLLQVLEDDFLRSDGGSSQKSADARQKKGG
jgi:hypothetical protein